MNDFDEADIREMRRQGDLRAFMRQQLRPMRTPDSAASGGPKPPGHVPGAWPTGSSPPGPPPDPVPPAAWAEALDEYRRYRRRTDRPDLDRTKYRCECGACPTDDPRSQT